MSYIWTPEPGELARVRDSKVTSLSRTVTAVGDVSETETDPITGEPLVLPDPNIFTPSGLPSIFDFTVSGNSFTVSTDQIPYLFPIEVTYLQTEYADSQNTVTSWNQLPPSSAQMVKLRTTKPSPYAFTFSVTASYNGNDPETVSYSIVIIHSYTANKLTLQSEVNKRR